jgi:hypothetical protein
MGRMSGLMPPDFPCASYSVAAGNNAIAFNVSAETELTSDDMETPLREQSRTDH